jgi:pyridinium-3,5-bisthiocarboxylic acid mononucleotide nickel chelatase
MNPELYGHIMEKLFAAGAVDVFMAPVQMKKNRPAVLLSALCSPEIKQGIIKTFYTETTTLGVRISAVERWCLPRETRKIETAYGTVTVKIIRRGDDLKTAAPEYESCRELALKHSIPLAEVYAAAQEAIRKMEL